MKAVIKCCDAAKFCQCLPVYRYDNVSQPLNHPLVSVNLLSSRGLVYHILVVQLPCDFALLGVELCVLIYAQIDQFAYTKRITAHRTFDYALFNAIPDIIVLIFPLIREPPEALVIP